MSISSDPGQPVSDTDRGDRSTRSLLPRCAAGGRLAGIPFQCAYASPHPDDPHCARLVDIDIEWD